MIDAISLCGEYIAFCDRKTLIVVSFIIVVMSPTSKFDTSPASGQGKNENKGTLQ